MVIITIILGFIIYFLNRESEVEYFNEVDLPETNTVYNSSDYKFMDTIVTIGLQEINVKDRTVLIRNMPKYVSDNFDNQNNMQLEASVFDIDDTYIIYVTSMGRKDAIKILSHELIHLKQYDSHKLIILSDGFVSWNGKKMSVTDISYIDRPWEIEAFDGQEDLQDKIEKILY